MRTDRQISHPKGGAERGDGGREEGVGERERVWEAHGRPSLPSQVYEKRIEGETCEQDGEDDMNSGSERGREEGREERRGEGGKVGCSHLPQSYGSRESVSRAFYYRDVRIEADDLLDIAVDSWFPFCYRFHFVAGRWEKGIRRVSEDALERSGAG